MPCGTLQKNGNTLQFTNCWIPNKHLKQSLQNNEQLLSIALGKLQNTGMIYTSQNHLQKYWRYCNGCIPDAPFCLFEDGRRDRILNRHTASKSCTLLADLCGTIRRFAIASCGWQNHSVIREQPSTQRCAKSSWDLTRTIRSNLFRTIHTLVCKTVLRSEQNHLFKFVQNHLTEMCKRV